MLPAFEHRQNRITSVRLGAIRPVLLEAAYNYLFRSLRIIVAISRRSSTPWRRSTERIDGIPSRWLVTVRTGIETNRTPVIQSTRFRPHRDSPSTSRPRHSVVDGRPVGSL